MGKILLGLVLLFTTSLEAAPTAMKRVKMLDGVTGTGAGSTGGPNKSGERTFHGYVVGTGAVTATIVVQASNDPDNFGWLTLGTITLSGTTSDQAGFASDAGWLYYRGNVTAITGTGAAAYLYATQE